MELSQLIRITACGAVEGDFVEKTNTLRWLGVPYAASPVGENRWRAPGPARSGTASGGPRLSPPQPAKIRRQGHRQRGLPLSEHLPPADTAADLPVLFLIHGGNNQTDAGEMFDGDELAALWRPWWSR